MAEGSVEWLAAVRERLESGWEADGGFRVLYGDAEEVVASDIYVLLAEVERLYAREAALREHLALVLDDAEVFGWRGEWITKARELLGAEEEGNG